MEPLSGVACAVVLQDLLVTRPYGAADADLAALEGEIGRPLPPDVRAFLTISDGSEWTQFPSLGVQVHSVATMLGLWRVFRLDRGAAKEIERCLRSQRRAAVILAINDDGAVATMAFPRFIDPHTILPSNH